MGQISYGTITITDTTDIERIYPVYCKGGESNAPSLQPLINWSENIATAGGSGKYIWQRIVTKKQGITVTANDYSDAVRLTGDDGGSLTISSTQYAQTENENDTPSYGNSMPSSINEGWWLWIKVNYSDGSSVETKVKQGEKGDQGISITGTKEIYFLKRTTDNVPTAPADGVVTTSTSRSGGVWTTVVPDYIEGGVYYTSIQTSYSDGTSPKSSPAVINQGLTDANAKALDAYNTSIARDTEINAMQAQAKHYWWDSQGAHVAAGENTTNVNNITQGSPSTYGFNSLMAPGYLALKHKNIDFTVLATNSLTFYRPATDDSNNYVQGKKAMDLTADALTFYKPLAYNSSNEPTAAAILNVNGLILSEGGIVAGESRTNDFIYLSSVNFADTISGHSAGTVSLDNYTATDWRQLIGTKFGVRADGTLYASNAEISGKITVGSGSNVYTKTEADGAFDASGAASAAQAAAEANAAADATSKANAAQAAAEANAAADATSKANAVNSALEAYKTSTNSTLIDLQNQVDGQVEVWYYSVDPTTSNPPASTWDTDALKARHEGDLYYNTNNGHSWRWLKNGNDYSWQQIPDGDAAAALAKATEALGVANNKRRIFTAQPTTPYEVGDLWVNGSEVKYCQTSRASGNYTATDWVLTATDDTKANSAVDQEQLIYKQAVSGTNSMAAYPSTATSTVSYWVTATGESVSSDTGGLTPVWTTKRPTYRSNYPVLFVAKQRKNMAGIISCTTPIKDDTTTVIDGGHITTGTIDAARLNVSDIIASGSIAVTSDIPDDISDLTDNTGVIPDDLSDLTDSTNIITNAVSTGVAGKADKTDAIQEEQLIYIQATSGTNSVPAYPSSATTTSSYWVTQSGESILTGTPPDSATGLTPIWTTKRPSYQKNYPVIFIAKQRKTVSGIITCTTPLKDDTLTIIDGGHITTGTIDASRLSVYDATINKISASAIDVTSIQIGQSQVNNLTTDLSNKANSSDSNWTVIITTSGIPDFVTPSITLVATIYHKGVIATSGFSTPIWYKDGTTILSGATYANGKSTITVTDMDAYYTCSISSN